ncbi:MAG TPA: histidine phosphatase family protein [Stellaceae bacterium]|nr:histidine phosphatase family protein [Stellaceae bacterium]
MTRLALIRHAPTAWSATGRLQGRADVPLDPRARPDWRLPAALDGFRVVTSPLGRAVDTARLLGVEATVEPLLTEMDWGAWEGETVAGLRARLGAAMTGAEAEGLDFRPPGGESPRDVQARLAPLLRYLAERGEPTAAITHKGVIRAVFAEAAGWDMLGKPPVRLSWDAAHLFRLDRDGRPSVEALNLSLIRRPREGGGPGATAPSLALGSRLRGNDDGKRSRP